MSDIVLAFASGVLTIAAPCILPMLPLLLGTSVARQSRLRPVCMVLGFTLSFSALALVFGAFSSALGLSQEALRSMAIALLILFGVLMVMPVSCGGLAARFGGIINRLHQIGSRAGNGNLGGFVIGITLGAVWTPCAGPVLASILTLVATANDFGRAATLLGLYALGAGMPMLAIAYGGQFVTTRVRQLARHTRRIQQGFGVLIVLTALAMHYQYDTLATVWLLDLYAGLFPGER